MVDLKQCKSTGNMVADMIANCIYYHETRGQHLEAIFLNDSNYRSFSEFVQKKYKDKEFEKDAVFTINNVDIKRGNLYVKRGMYWKLRDMKPPVD